MKKERIDMTGQSIGSWLVLGYDYTSRHGHAFWRCLCDCGKVCSVDGNSLRRPEAIQGSKSCGCKRNLDASKRMKNFYQQIKERNKLLAFLINERLIENRFKKVL